MTVCARPGCGNELDFRFLRADAKYCGQACRRDLTPLGGFRSGRRSFGRHGCELISPGIGRG